MPKISEKLGIFCVKCGSSDSMVRRIKAQHGRILRYRKCRSCGENFATSELLLGTSDDSSSISGTLASVAITNLIEALNLLGVVIPKPGSICKNEMGDRK